MLRGSMAIAEPLQKYRYKLTCYSTTLLKATSRGDYSGKINVRTVAACITSPANKAATSHAGDEQALPQVEGQLVTAALRIERGAGGRVRMRQHGTQEGLHARVVARGPGRELHH